jgi:hypothetical protein
MDIENATIDTITPEPRRYITALRVVRRTDNHCLLKFHNFARNQLTLINTEI